MTLDICMGFVKMQIWLQSLSLWVWCLLNGEKYFSAITKHVETNMVSYGCHILLWREVFGTPSKNHVISLPCSLRKILCNPSEWAGTHSPPTNPRAPPLAGAPVFLSVNVEYKSQLSRMWRARRFKEGCGGGSMLGSGPESLCVTAVIM